MRPLLLAAIALIALPAAAQLGGLGSLGGLGGIGVPAPIKRMLGRASDNALDKLGKPGAFSADKAISIGLPMMGGGGALGGLLGGASKMLGGSAMAGVTDGLNRAAEAGARGAKPVMRAAIDHMTARDAAGIATGGAGSATAYLQKSSMATVVAGLKPLVGAELAKTGMFAKIDQLIPGVGGAQLTDHVARGAAKGIFTYMGAEEKRLRSGGAGGLLH